MNGAEVAGRQRLVGLMVRQVAWLGLLLLTLTGCALPFGGASSSAPSPTATPRPLTPDELAAQMVAQMSLDDKLGQMLIIEFSETTYTSTQQEMAHRYHPGGLLLPRHTLGTAQQVKDLLASAQQDSPIPMFTFLHLEGGSIDPLAQYLGNRTSPSHMATARPTFAENEGGKVAKDLLSFGFNADIAPYLSIGADSRSFGATPDQVTTYGGAWLTGLQKNGVVGCALPFPGAPGAVELEPYRALIASGDLQMIMSTTEVIPPLDPSLPAALSKTVITGALRNDLHFTGVAITDALYLAAISQRFSLTQAAVMAIEAGADMINGLYTPAMLGDVVTALKAEIAAGKLSQQQVDTSVTRILSLKLRYHVINTPSGAR